MAISLSELTGASTSGNVLNEVNSYADFLDSVPRLVNKADPSGATDAVQTTATNQPKALPLIDGEGYLYCSQVAGNYASVTEPVLPSTADFDVSIDFIIKSFASSGYSHLLAQYQGGAAGRVHFGFYDFDQRLYFFVGGDGTNPSVDIKTAVGAVTEGQRHTARVTRVGNTFSLYLNGVLQQTGTSGVALLQTLGTRIGWGNLNPLNGAIFSVTEGSNFECDFNSPRIPHGAREFTCETGQVVTVNTSGNDPATIIKKGVLRFSDVANTSLSGLLNQTVTDGYMFAAFSVLGDGGESSGRILGLNSTGGVDSGPQGVGFRRNGSTNDLMIRYNENNITTHSNFFNDERGDYLLEAKVQNASQQSKVNNADADNGIGTVTGQLSVEEFSVGSYTNSLYNNAAIDLEYLALFPASLSDSQADQIRNFINNRNRVFSLIDSQGYFFFDGAATDDGQVLSSSTPWNGRIVGSDNGDSDFYISQNTLDDRPTTDGYKITFADNTDHFDTPQITLAAGDSYAWMVCGTSLGTFSYKVTVSGQTELNLLGHLGDASYRQAGDLYGIILLPEDATNRDIEEARKLLIDRGAADGVSVTQTPHFFRNRTDILDFKPINMDDVTDVAATWRDSSITSFNVELPKVQSANGTWRGTDLTSFGVQLPEAISARFAWSYCSSLSSFTTTDIKKSSDFTSAWNGTTSLTSFPADATLGTEASNVDFTSAWRSSGLTSFSTPLPTAGRVDYAWRDCTSLISFEAAIGGSNFYESWKNCSNLTDFSPNVFDTIGTPISFAFVNSFEGCPALSSNSVENILVSIDTSGQSAPSSGPEITIDYNVSTGALSAATTAAITSLKTKGWSIFINSVEQ